MIFIRYVCYEKILCIKLRFNLQGETNIYIEEHTSIRAN